MDTTITYKNLKQAFGFSIQSLKRAALTIFGIGPGAGGGRGMSREFSLDSSFLIYLCLVLVREHRMTLKEAFAHVWEINKALFDLYHPEVGQPPVDLHPSFQWTYTDRKPHIILEIFTKMAPPVYGYKIYPKGFPKEGEINWERGEVPIEEAYTLRCVPRERIGDLADGSLPGPARRIWLTAHLGDFIITMRSLVS